MLLLLWLIDGSKPSLGQQHLCSYITEFGSKTVFVPNPKYTLYCTAMVLQFETTAKY